MDVVQKNVPKGVVTERWDSEKVYTHEPKLRREPRALGGLWIPGESVIDPFAFPITLLRLAKSRGCEVLCNHELISATLETGSINGNNGRWKLEMNVEGNRQILYCGVLINCAGNYGDIVENRILHAPAPFTITPRKGQFIVYEQAASRLLDSVILPIPSIRTKGVLLCKTAFGNVIVGPTAEDQTERENGETNESTLRMLQEKGETLLPGLKAYKIIGCYAGLRPATEHREYQIRYVLDKNYICVGGIRSTGLTASMGIAESVCNTLVQEYKWNIDSTVQKGDNIISLASGKYTSTSQGLQYICGDGDIFRVSHKLPNISYSEQTTLHSSI